MIQRHKKKGFTIVELMLAMAFISVLLLAIVMIAIQTGKLYSRGMTLRTVNSAGRDISTMLRKDFAQSDQRQVSAASSTSAVIKVLDGGNEHSARFCLGAYSYLWNNPKVIDGGLTSSAVVIGPNNKPINFVRVVDPDGVMCRKDLATGRYPSKLTNAENITHLLKAHSDDEVVLAVHSLEVKPGASVDESPDGLFTVDFTIGTSRLSEINTSQQCKPPNDSAANVDYCAINKFNMIVRTNGQKV